MSIQRSAAQLRCFITAQECRYHLHPSYSSTKNYVLPQRSIHIQSMAKIPDATIPNTLRQRIVYPLWNYPSSSQLITRRFATAAADVTETGTTRTAALLVAVPKPEEVGSDEEVELLSQEEARVNLTERAAEKLRAISAGENDPSLALRISVESGGCHGYQYKMELTSHRAPDDYKFIHPTYRPASIVIDAVSLGLLKGSTVDYASELIGSSFSVIDNPQAKGSGCGCGVSWEAKF